MPLFSAYSAMLKHAKPYIKNISGVFFHVFKSMKKVHLNMYHCTTETSCEEVRKTGPLEVS